MRGLLLRGGRVIDPASSLDAFVDVLVVDGIIQAVGRDLEVTEPHETVDVREQIVSPGLIDLHST